MRGAQSEISGDAGFTLLELLVAMSLLGLLSLVLLGGLRFGSQIWRVSGDAMVQENRIRLVQIELAREIGGAYPAFATVDASHAHVVFDGEESRLSFLAPDSALSGGLALTTIDSAPDGSQIVLRSQASPELAARPVASARILLRGLKSVQFAYFGRDTPHDEPAWHAEWQDRTSPPSLIRVRVSFADARARPWPDLVVVPHVSADVGCVLDTLTKYCQSR